SQTAATTMRTPVAAHTMAAGSPPVKIADTPMISQARLYQSGAAGVARSGAVSDSLFQGSAGPIARKRPVTAPPTRAPLPPPKAWPRTRAPPPGKKSNIIGGTRTNHPAAANTPISPRNTAVDAKKPSITAVGANGKTVGTSRAGRAPG